MKIVIAEDDARSRLLLRHMIETLTKYDIVQEAVNGEELIQAVMEKQPDIVLVDIGLPLLNGMEAVKSCKKLFPSMQVIFTTGYDEYALEAFDVHAIDYIVKPIRRERLYEALERAADVCVQYHRVPLERSQKKNLTIRQQGQVIFIPLEDILFIERAERKAVVHTSQKKYEMNEALAHLEGALDSRFLSSHRSYLVNINELTHIEAIGQNYKAYFRNYAETAKVSKNKLAELQKHKSS